ncbi:MAG TPA: hydroxyacid dehydrogenase [Spirochaetia bacterium]|nr:hydroxyacid dehydrogenase [Spirochaetia bacterium]
MKNSERLILMDPHPRRIDLIFSEEEKRRLGALGKVLWFDGERAAEDYIDRHIGEACALIGQTAMPKERLDRASNLRAIFNVEGNFLPNIDYEECHRRNIYVMAAAPAFTQAVAEMALGFALAAARGIVQADADARRGAELYGGASNLDNFLLGGKTVGIVGFGNVGQGIGRLLEPFKCTTLVHDPWLHEHYLERFAVKPVGLEELFSRSRVVFIVSAATTENQKGIGAEMFGRMQEGSVVVLVGRSEVVNFDDMLDAAGSGHIRAAIDVFPQEPLPPDHRARKTPNTILSAHRAGGLPETYREMGRMVVDDLELILRDLPPQRMQRALLETVARYRSKPIKG